MTVAVRLLDSPDELARAWRTFRTAMVGFATMATSDADLVRVAYQPGRTFGAFDDARLVGTVNSYSGWLQIPGGTRVSHEAITHVGVLPTDTRRGVLSALFAAQLRDARTRGAVAATLRASEGTIYGRFGFGIASAVATIELDARARLGAAVPRPAGRVRLLAVDEARELMPAVYRDHGAGRAGRIERSRYWWALRDIFLQGTRDPSYVAVYSRDGVDRGYVRYHAVPTGDWFVSGQRTAVVDDLVADAPDTLTALLGHLLSVDLLHRIVLPARPVDDALPWLLHDPRQARVTAVRDETWLRLLDVPAALAARRYGPGRPVVLQATDPLIEGNQVRLRLSPEGAAATQATADAETDVATLSAAFLGGTPWRHLAAAGRLRACDPEVVAGLDALFATAEAPHSGTMF